MTFETDLLTAMRTVTSAAYAFPAKAPPAVYATYQRISGRLHGTLNSGLGAPRGTFQIDCWSKVKGQAVELAENLKYNFPEYIITNVRVIKAYDQITDTHGIAVTALFSGEEIGFFTNSEGLLELWRKTRQTLGTLEHITNARA